MTSWSIGMRISWCGAAVALLGSLPAWAGSTVIWLESAPPDPSRQARVEKATGGARHLAYEDVAYPVEPWSSADEQEYSALRDQWMSARSRWEEFDVEFALATELGATISAIDVVRDARDADALNAAIWMQGAAVQRAFSAQEFQSGERAAPFRWTYGGAAEAWNGPWVVALGIDPDHRISQADAEASTWADLQTLQPVVDALPDARMVFDRLPEGAEIVIDGVKFAATAKDIAVRPGRHYVHLLRDGQISARSIVDSFPGASAAFPVRIDAAVLTSAKSAWLEGQPLPEAAAKAIEAVVAGTDGPVFLAALDEGKPVVRPHAHGAALVEDTPITALTFGDFGASLHQSALFDGSGGDPTLAMGLTNSLGFELGIYNGALLGGADVSLTPGQTVTFGNRARSANVTISAIPGAWGGLGAYALRPLPGRPSILLAGTVGWSGPAYTSVGGRVVFGVPSKQIESRWLRLVAGYSTSVTNHWDASGPSWSTYYLRIGVGQGF
jgi:hypothetical protein